MVNIKNILIGWGKSMGALPTSEAETKLSDLRVSICGNCMFSKRSKVLEIIKGEVFKSDTLSCMKCGCPCREKSLVVAEKCPINRW